MALLVNSNLPMGNALKNIAPKSLSTIKIIEKRNVNGIDCLATNLGAVFSYVEHTDDIPSNFGASFRIAICILNLGKFQTEQSGLIRLQHSKKVIFTLAHNAEEAAEFVLSLVSRLSDSDAQNQAKRWVREAYFGQFSDPKDSAFKIAQRGFPINKEETNILLEAFGSLLDLVHTKTKEELASHCPLSDADVSMIAKVLGLSDF